MFESTIMEFELDDRGKHDKTTDGKLKTKKSNLVDLNRVRKQPHKCPGKKDVPINNCFESCQGEFSVKILEKDL